MSHPKEKEFPTIITGDKVTTGNSSSDSSSPQAGTGTTEDALKTKAALLIIINASAQAITLQPRFIGIEKVKGLEEANKHLETAKSHANDWLKVHSKAVLSTLQGVISFGTLFNQLYSPLHTTAKTLGNESSFDQKQIDALITQIQALQMVVQEQHTAVDKVYKDIMTYQELVNIDYSNFTTHLDKVHSTLTGDQERIKQLTKEIEDDQDERNTASILGIISACAAGVAGIAIVVGVGIAVAVATGGLAAPLVIAGVAVTVKGIGTVGAITAGIALGTGATGAWLYLSKAEELLQKIQANALLVNELSTEVNILNTIKLQFRDLTTHLATIGDVLSKLSNSWKDFDYQLSKLVSDLQKPQDFLKTLPGTSTPAMAAMVVVTDLQTAQRDWNKTLERAEVILKNYAGVKYVTTDRLPTANNIEKYATVIA